MSEQISQEADFDPADINPVIPDDVNIEIAKLVFNWAKFDALITNLLFQLMLIPSDLGQIRIRRMGITDKQSRLRTY